MAPFSVIRHMPWQAREAAPVVDDSCRHAYLPQNSMVFTSWWFPKGRYVDAYLQKPSRQSSLRKLPLCHSHPHTPLYSSASWIVEVEVGDISICKYQGQMCYRYQRLKYKFNYTSLVKFVYFQVRISQIQS